MKYFNCPMSSSLFSSIQENTKCKSTVFADTCTRCVPIFVSAKQIYMLSQTYRTVTVLLPYRTVPYRVLTHSHSATSLYNLCQFMPISDQFTSIVYVVPASNLQTGVVWPSIILSELNQFTWNDSSQSFGS
jgi:hypothetical protein